MTKKIAVVLSGCGYRDGSEVTESVSVLLALSELEAEYECFAPNREFPSQVYLEGFASPRNALEESARIARLGHIRPLSLLQEREFDAVIFPGGMGAASNLSDWATAGAKCVILPDVRRVIKEFHKAMKPIGAICIAPVLVARVLGDKNPEVTIGDSAEMALEIEKTGAQHTKCAVDDYVSDRDHKILTTPAYMYDHAKPFQVYTGIRRMIGELVEMA